MDLTVAVHFLEETEQVEQVSRRQLRDISDVFNMPTNQFLANFRVSKDIFALILKVMQEKCSTGFRSTHIRLDIKLATFLRFLATGSYQRSIGNESVSSTDHVCPQWIKMPPPEEEREIMEEFFSRTGFPGVIGCVDGTHIRIKSPGDDIKRLYYNRKGYYSINAMVICDHKMAIRYVDAMYPGSNHDAFIWEYSVVDEKLQTAFDNGRRNAWILGDGGYKLKPFLMTPYRSPTDGIERRYNKKHASARNVVERCFGVLKNRFRCILSSRGLHYSPEKAAQIINACCAVHNMCIKFNCRQEECDDIEENDGVTDVEGGDEGDGTAVVIRRGQKHCQSIPVFCKQLYQQLNSFATF